MHSYPRIKARYNNTTCGAKSDARCAWARSQCSLQRTLMTQQPCRMLPLSLLLLLHCIKRGCTLHWAG